MDCVDYCDNQCTGNGCYYSCLNYCENTCTYNSCFAYYSGSGTYSCGCATVASMAAGVIVA